MFAIGEASKRSGVSIETIRYYEREGIVQKPARAENGRRSYSEAEIGQLRFIKRCRDLGFTIKDAKALLNFGGQTDASCKIAHDMSKAHLEIVREKIANLKRLERALEELMSNCASGTIQCPMLDQLHAD
ncbi:MerR family transcriptional regulator [Pseudovibrio sp. Tun.PSC04-5.I4]|uniref:MerR family transcriptional regulator n=1 Tax=Pseudovibrio sp. Tun.PSC04-5.I4 TaxID=1798213 RepID=UPI000886D342|nr:MerR family transcriptional regulator [Pseudovibrio sp. Tun.PSC04-5.I4]SDR47264.1 MerR family transcriptional regulator, mercuric resistance operon regulatory protein [Pseudovibrio sp. Tun.PSC04-5.I4]